MRSRYGPTSWRVFGRLQIKKSVAHLDRFEEDCIGDGEHKATIHARISFARNFPIHVLHSNTVRYIEHRGMDQQIIHIYTCQLAGLVK